MAIRWSKIDLGGIGLDSGDGVCETMIADARSCTVVLLSRDGRAIVVTFAGFTKAQFGYPNDEALRGRRDYARLDYGIFEADGSGWAESLGRQNRVAFPGWNGTFSKKRHFAIVLKEVLVEVLADDIDFRVCGRDFDAVAMEALKNRLNDTGPTTIVPR